MHAMEEDSDPLAALFEAACLSSGESTVPSARDSETFVRDNSMQNTRITSESQWRKFSNSLASEGLVVELREQKELQKMWEHEVTGSSAFGRRIKPSLRLEDVHRCVDNMYQDDTSVKISYKISGVRESVRELGDLLDAWNIHSFNHTQTRQPNITPSLPAKALQVLHRLGETHRRSCACLEKKQALQRRDFITESVLQMMGGINQLQLDGQDGGSDHRSGDDEGGHSQCSPKSEPCNPLLWQANNAGLVDQKVTKAKVTAIRYSGKQGSFKKRSATQCYGGVEDDPWGVSQGLAGSQGVYCRRGFVNRQNEEVPVTVVVMPKAELGYAARDKLWRAFLAHRQLAVGCCVMHSLGVADRDPEETLFYYESSRARGALVCLAQLSEQSTFSLQRRISIGNFMIGVQGSVIRLGGLRWGPEVDDTGQAAEAAMEQRDAELCLGFADTLEGFLGTMNGNKTTRVSEDFDAVDDLKYDTRAVVSPVLLNILACLRFPPRFREGITLKGLLGHQYFAPLSPESIEGSLPGAWKTFIDDTRVAVD